MVVKTGSMANQQQQQQQQHHKPESNWRPSSSSSAPHFFKILLPTAIHAHKLRIPEKFVKEFGGELSSDAILTVPRGRVWHIGLENSEDGIWFDENWQEFVEFYSITYGYFLVFKYEGKSRFHVLIFDPTACEIRYPCDNPRSDEQSDQEEDVGAFEKRGLDENCEDEHRMYREDEERAGAKKRKMDDQEEKLCSHSIRTSSDGKLSKSDMPASQGSMSDEARDSDSHQCKNAENFDKVGKSTRTDERECSISANESESHSSDNARRRTRTRKHEDAQTSRRRNRRLFNNLSVRRPVTDKERFDALCRARMFQSENPFFLTLLRQHQVHNPHMYVPLKFSEKYISGTSGWIKLEVSDGRQWPVWYTYNRCAGSGKNLRMKGWAAFYRENFLEEGDVCVFELIKTDDIVLKVSIFRVVEDYEALN